MNFASAYISLMRGHKIARSHWGGYWVLEGNDIFIYTYDGKKINMKASDDMPYTVSNMACDDWHIVDNYGAKKEYSIRGDGDDNKRQDS